MPLLEDIGFKPQPGTEGGPLVKFARIGAPVLITIAGIVLMVIGHGSENSPVAVTGLVFVGVAIMVWMLNWMFRMSVLSNDERVQEEAARDFYTLHGYWQDDEK